MPGQTEEKNRAILIRLLEEVDKGNLEVVDELYSDHYVDNTPSPIRGLKHGKAGVQNALKLFYSAFPDTRHKIHLLIAEGDYVVAHMDARGTHTGSFFGKAPTHQEVVLSGIAIYKFSDGKITERWAYNSQPSVLAQLGIGSPEDSL